MAGNTLGAGHQQALAQRHRTLVVISGPPDWARDQGARLWPQLPAPALWVGDEHCPLAQAERCEAANTQQRLGSELGGLVWDSFAGLHPSGFGAITGALMGGGIMLWLVPPLSQWGSYPDPDYDRLREHAPPYRFLSRFARLLATAPGVLWHTPEAPLALGELTPGGAPGGTAPIPISWPSATVTPDQRQALAAIMRVGLGHRHRPLVLRADRGRGKSSALGLAARALIKEGLRVGVTAPRPGALDSFWQWLAEDRSRCHYRPPDRLLMQRPELDLLLVDEAAAIPVPLLQAMLAHYPRVVFATTVHGYEGTGRGFDLRFRETLDRVTPQWQQLNLTTPVRWGDHDPLEALVHRLLLLNATMPELGPPPAALPGAASALGQLQFECCDRDRLLGDEASLEQIVGLLVSAHYQTSPDDLRQLLDDPDTGLWVAWQGSIAVGVLWLLQEGGLSEELAQAVWRGERRPRGHLLAQSLAAQGGDPAAARARYGRITRIAVHPGWRRQGLGQALVDQARSALQAEGVDMLGVSFGASEGLLGFWRHCGLQLLRLGLRRDPASGSYTAMLAQPLTATGEQLVASQSRRFATHWPLLLLTRLTALEPSLVWALTESLPPGPRPDAQDLSELQAFAHGQRDTALTLLPLQRCHGCLAEWASGISWSPSDQALWVGVVCQGASWDQLRQQRQIEGRKEGEKRLRGMAAEVLQQL
ncbi:MAG: tRNA(Met) cytidine acetyltransferase [Halomonadaceae bacterium]|nr:MAG: tRNA(Met) cytidine acetyltransferase [Halomonadaceae bacterium]